jgi:glycine dehydrogenase
MAGMYAVYHGPKGLKSIAQKINNLCSLLNNNLRNLGIKQLNKSFFDTLHIKTDSIKLKKLAVDKKINFNYINNNEVSISLNEATEIEDVELIFDIISSLEGQKN